MLRVTLTLFLIYSFYNFTYCTPLDKSFCFQNISLGIIFGTTKYKDNNWPVIVRDVLEKKIISKILAKRIFFVSGVLM